MINAQCYYDKSLSLKAQTSFATPYKSESSY